MNANATATQYESEDERSAGYMSASVVKSLFFHGTIVVMALVGMPFMHKPLPTISDPIPVEIIDMSEKATTNRPPQRVEQSQTSPAQPRPEPPKPVAPTQTATEPPKPPARPAEEKAKAQEKAPAKEPEKAPAIPKDPPKEPPKAPPAKPERPKLTEPEKAEETPTQDFNAVLRNLIKNEAQNAPIPNTAQTGAENSPNAPQAAQMSRSEMDAVRRQLESCWKLLAGARYAEDQVVAVRIFVNRDRTVRDAQIVDQVRYMTDSFFRAAADAALRAVHNPACTPLDLPPEKYDLWKDMIFNFDPRGML